MLKFALSFIFAVVFLSASEGAFQDMDFDARSAGMGGASSLVDGELPAVLGNVAILGFARDFQIGFTHSSIFANLVRAEFAGISLPFGKFASLGIWGSMLGDSKGIYSEKILSLGYAVRPASNFALGLAAKLLKVGYDPETEPVKSNPYFSRTSSLAFSGDIGVSVAPTEELSIGISLQNIIPADTSISESENRDQVPVVTRVSISYRFSSIASNVQQEIIGRFLAKSQGTFELSQRTKYTTIRLGIESWLNKLLAVRLGYAHSSGELQSSSLFSVGGGLNLKLDGMKLRLDYAYQTVVGDLVDNTSHRVSSTLSF